MGAGVTKKQNDVVANNYKIIKYANVTNINGHRYCEINRKDYKLSSDILSVIQSKNNFSCDHDEGLNIVKVKDVIRK